MTGWSKRVDESSLDCLEANENRVTEKLCFDLGIGSKIAGGDAVEENEQKKLFEEELSRFFKGFYGSACLRPFPPMLGNGEPVDLFKLYLIVRGKGGYDEVSEQGLWDSVAVESGLNSGLGSAVKIVYVKYLNALSRLLERGAEDKDSEGGLQDSARELSGCSMGLDRDDRGTLSEISNNGKRNGDVSLLGLGMSPLKSMSPFKLGNESSGNDGPILVEVDEGSKCGDEVKIVADGKDNPYSDRSICTEDDPSRKKKRESDQIMLGWLVEIAKDPCNPNVKPMPGKSKWKCYGTELSWRKVLLSREALFLKRNGNLGSDLSDSNWLVCLNLLHSILLYFVERVFACSKLFVGWLQLRM